MNKKFDRYFYEGILENPNITDDIINKVLYKKPNKIIMEAIAGSEKSSSQHLEYIYNEIKNFGVQLNLASNKNTPHNILKKLFKDFTEEVYENPNIPPDLISDFLSQKKPRTKKERENYDNNWIALAHNPALSKEEQLKIAKKMKFNPDIQWNLYLNPALHFETFEYLWSKGVTNCAEKFLSSSNFESTCIDMLLGSDDDFIRCNFNRMRVLSNPKINHDKIIDLLEINNVNKKITAKPCFILPNWYQKLVAITDEIIIDDDSFSHFSFPKIFIPSLKDTIESHDEVIGVIGGYYFQSKIGDKNINHGWAPPVLQLNLKILSKKTGINFGENILQVWGSSDDWGLGQEVYCDEVNQDAVVDRNDNHCVKVDLPKDIVDAEQHDQATACFDWSESCYSEYLGLNAPYFITDLNYAGINTQLFTTKEESILEEILNKKSIDTTEISAFANEESYFEFTTLVSALQFIQRLRLSTSVGNFDKENYIILLERCTDDFIDDDIDDDGFDGPKNWKRHGRLAWKPLITIEGPSGWGVEDYYSVYYRQNERGDFEYKAMARRWCY